MTTPVEGAIAVVIRDGAALLVRRANPPDAGLWGYPGGHVEVGESPMAAAERELMEETGVEARALRVVGHLDIPRTNETPPYRLTVVECAYVSGAPVAATDASAAAWVARAEIEANALPLSHGARQVLEMIGRA